MKSSKLLFGRVLLIITALVFFMSQNLMAQEKDEEGKVVKIKISKKEGNNVVIDTIYSLNTEDLEGMDLHDELERVIDIELDGIEDTDADVLKEIYISLDVDDDMDIDTDIEKNVMIWTSASDDSNCKVIELKCIDESENVIFFSDDDTTGRSKMKRMIIKSDGGDRNVMYIKSGKDGKALWVTDEDNKIEVDKGYVYIMDSEGDSNEITIKSTYFGDEDGEHTIIYTTDDCDKGEFSMSMKKASEARSAMSMYKIDGEGEPITIIIHTLEIESLEEEDKDALDKAGIKLNEASLELEDLMFFPNPNEGQFSLSFSTEAKGDLNIKVVDINGKVVHKESFNNFTGKYNKEIDITENSKGIYFLIIQHGKDMAAHKIIYE